MPFFEKPCIYSVDETSNPSRVDGSLLCKSTTLLVQKGVSRAMIILYLLPIVKVFSTLSYNVIAVVAGGRLWGGLPCLLWCAFSAAWRYPNLLVSPSYKSSTAPSKLDRFC